VQCIVHETLQVRRANARIVNKGFTISEPKTPKSRRSIQLAQMTIDALKRHRIRQHELRLRRFSQSYHSLS